MALTSGYIDVDGTLGDTQNLAITEGTLPVMREFQRKILGLRLAEDMMYCWQTGRPVTNQQFLDSIGSRSMIDMLEQQNSLYDNRVPEETLIQWDMKEAGRVIEAFGRPGALKRIPGARTLLLELRRFGVRMHAVSSSSVDRLCITLRGLGIAHLLDGVYSAQGNNGYYTEDSDGLLARVHSVASPHHYKRPLPKPHPAVYQLALWLTGTNAADTFTIEDSAAGVRPARETGIGYVIGLNTTGCPVVQQTLWDAGAHVVIPSLRDALPLLCDRFSLQAA